MSANQKSDMEFIMFLSTYIKAKLLLRDFMKDERGVTAIEYAVLGVAVAAIVLAVFTDSAGGALYDALVAGIGKIQSSMTGTGTGG